MSPLTEPTKLVLTKPTGASLRVAPIGRGGDLLYSQAGTPSLDLRFAEKKTLTDYVSGNNLVTFSRPVGANQSPGTYVDENGLIQLSSANTPRFDHDPTTGESLGLLVEEARINVYQRSQAPVANDLSNASITLNSSTAPDNTFTAPILTPTGSPTHAWAPYFTGLTANIDYTLSLFVKAKELSRISLGTISNTGMVFNASTGQIISGSGTVQALPNGWYRCSTTIPSSGSGVWDTRVYIQDNNGNTTYAANGTDGIYLWGFQLEAGAFPTSYIPTAGTAVTRAADVASITGANFSSWYNQSEGTVFTDARMQFALSQPGTFPAIYTSGSYPNRLWSLYLLNGPNTLTVGADTHSVGLQAFGSSPQTFKVAQALSNDNLTYGVSKDGAVALTGSLSKAITNTSSIAFGSQVGAVRHISRLTYFPVRLPDATLQTITT